MHGVWVLLAPSLKDDGGVPGLRPWVDVCVKADSIGRVRWAVTYG